MNKLNVKELTKRYKSKVALDNVSLELIDGIYGIVGPNGAGKSTLLKIITTILKSDEGEVFFNGSSIINNQNYRDILGYMPQQQSLPNHLTLEHFLFYVAALKGISTKNAKAIISELLIKLNLEEHKGKSTASLSGGMKQRVLMAQALLNNPSLLILDEPTAGLDPIERSNLRDLIVEISRNRIIIITSHIISDLEYIADTIILMKNGEIKAIDNQEKLLQNVVVYETLMKRDEYLEFRKKNNVVNSINVGEEILVRHFNEGIEGKLVETTLEDVYLRELR